MTSRAFTVISDRFLKHFVFLLFAVGSGCSPPTVEGAHPLPQPPGQACAEALPPPPPSTPCSRLASRLPEASEVDWGYEPDRCPDASYAVADAPSDRIAAAGLVGVLGSSRELVFCGGNGLLAQLGWPALKAGSSRARLRYAAGPYVVYSGCTKERQRVTLEGGQLAVEIDGGAAFVTPSDLQLQTVEPGLVRTVAASVPKQCNVHAVAAATRDAAELCLSAYRGTSGEVAYASFRSSCD